MAKDVATFQSNKSGYPIPFGQAHHHSVGLSTYDMYIYVYTYVYVYIYIIVRVVYMYVHMHIHLHDHATILPLFSHYYPILPSPKLRQNYTTEGIIIVIVCRQWVNIQPGAQGQGAALQAVC